MVIFLTVNLIQFRHYWINNMNIHNLIKKQIIDEEQGAIAGIVVAVVLLFAIGLGLFMIAHNNDMKMQSVNTGPQETTEPTEAAQTIQKAETLLETAESTPSLSTLVEAIEAAELSNTLSAAGPFTVFAPDNEAFESTLEEINSDRAQILERDDLGDILKLHVVSGDVASMDLSDGQDLVTLQGGTLKVDVDGNNITLTDENGRSAQITTANVDAKNGTVHIINNVLLLKSTVNAEPDSADS